MSSEFQREIRKLEARFGNYRRVEQEFVRQMKGCIKTFRKLTQNLQNEERISSSKEIERLLKLKRNAIKSLSQVLKSESSVEHEKSHLLESYGALIISFRDELENAK